jgi:hypothetical protein
MAFLEGSRSVAEGSEPVAVEASETFEDCVGIFDSGASAISTSRG